MFVEWSGNQTGRMATGVGPPKDSRCGDERGEDPQQEQLQRPVGPQRVIRQPHRGGYDCEFVEYPPKAVQCECPICLLVLREPHQVTCCGNSFCATCVKRVLEEEKCCPTCNEADFTVFPDKRLKRTLNEYRVYCCQRGEGCDWVGELGELDRHLNLQPPPEKLLVGCQFSEVDCTFCVQPFQRRYVQAHQSDECPKRPYACPHCNKYAATFKATYEEVTQNHWPVCPFFPLSCPNNCDLELVLQRQEVEHHVSRDCPLTVVQCDFHTVGCHVQLKRRDMPSHINENITGHISLLHRHVTTYPAENTSQNEMIAAHAKELQDARERISQLEATGIAQQEQNKHLQGEVDSCRRENKTLQQQKHDLSERLTASEQKIQALDTQLAAINDEKKQLHHKLEECSTRLEEHQQNTTLALDQQKGENNEKLRLAEDEHSKRLIASEHRMYTTLIIVGLFVCLCVGVCWALNAQLTQQKLKEMLSASQQKIQTQEATLNQHQKALERVTYTGTLPFEFTMTEFKKHKSASDEWYSPPFYTHTHGYRMCIRVNANDNGSGKGTHLSVFGYLMRSDFDDDLQWPFQGAITIQLLNQLEDSNHHTHTIDFTVSTNPNIISRVTSGERARNGYGTGTFLSHTQLGLNTDRNCQFLKNNQLKFRVSKATNLDPTARIHRRCLTLESFAGAIEPQVSVAPIEFTLSDFELQKKQNDVWYSPAFYTHPRGYRMCLKVNPNGYSGGLGTHVSIYTCIMRGPFDGGLKWPLRGDVTIQIVNQAGEDNHRKMVIPYTDKTPDSSAGRVTDREISGAWGFTQFLPHNSLGYNASRNTQYLQGDSLRIRISKVELKK